MNGEGAKPKGRGSPNGVGRAWLCTLIKTVPLKPCPHHNRRRQAPSPSVLQEREEEKYSSQRCQSRPSVEVVQGRDAWQHLALQKLQRGAATSGDEVHLVLHVPLGRGSGRVPAADDTAATRGGQLGNGLEERLGTLGEVVELEHAGGAVPDDCLRAHHGPH